VQQGDVTIVVQLALTGRFVAGIAVVVQILGVRQDDDLADEGERLVEDLLHPRQLAGMEQVRRIERDLGKEGKEYY
jgi:hypothetical protein